MDLHVALGAGPRRAQLERQLREGVRSGRLRPGARLPPSRALARELGVSRGVVVEAYAQLVAEGYLVARRGAGTAVAPSPPGGRGGSARAAPAARAAAAPASAAPPPIRFDLRTGRVDLSLFPRRAWLAATARAVRALPDAALGYGDPRGFAPLREALAAHLGRARGALADPARVLTCGGVLDGLPAVWRALARHGVRRVGVEDPGWRGQRRTVELAGLEAVPVPVDERGLVVDALAGARVDAVAVTPAHQFPTGVVLAPERRAQLAAWARSEDAVVVEDDYDAEYRYDREPVGALQGLAPDRVVYAGSASKTLAPAVGLGWIVAPPWLAGDVAEERERAHRAAPVLAQAALADLLGRGEVDRHLRRSRRRYCARRDALVGALGDRLPGVRVGGAAAGLHVVAWLPEGAGEAETAAAARSRGVAVHALHAQCTVQAPRPPALLLGYAALPEPSLARAARELAAVTS
jgi:GntR family transcriptional regulator/MocR family aminotransferase